jgi:hypothetical protein
MHITRRKFLQAGSAAAAFVVATGLNPVAAQERSDILFPIPPEVYSQPLYSMSAKQFRDLIGRNFSVVSGDGRVSRIVLVEVNVLERMANSTRGYYGESFSLIFENRGKDRLSQDVYELEGSDIEPVSVLLVPTGRASRQYELIVNHLTR